MRIKLAWVDPDKFSVSEEDMEIEHRIDRKLEELTRYVHCYVQTEKVTGARWIQVYDWSNDIRGELFVYKTGPGEFDIGQVFNEIRVMVIFS
jgi:hypothetical protein